MKEEEPGVRKRDKSVNAPWSGQRHPASDFPRAGPTWPGGS